MRFVSLITIMFLISACVTTYQPIPVPPRDGVSNDVLSKISPSKQTVKLNLQSKIEGTIHRAYEYGSNKTKLSQRKFNIDVNADVNKALDKYVSTKFLNSSSTPDATLSVTIEEFFVEYSYKSAKNAGALLVITNTYQGKHMERVYLKTNVVYENNNNKFSKTFVFDENTENDVVSAAAVGKSKPTVETKNVDHIEIMRQLLTIGYNDLIIRIDKFIEAANQ